MHYQIKIFEHPNQMRLVEKVNDFLRKTDAEKIETEFYSEMVDWYLWVSHHFCKLTYTIDD